MQDYESYFRLFKSSWGILVGFTGNIRQDEKDEKSNHIKINDSLSLKLNISNQNKFIHENNFFLKNGILWVADIIPRSTKGSY